MPFSRPLCTSLYPVSCIGDLSNVNMCLYFEQTPPCSVQDTWLKYKDLRHCVVRLRCKTKINICKYVFLSLRLYSQLHNTNPGCWPCWHIDPLLVFFCSWNPEASSENNVPSCVPTRSTPWVKFHPSWSCFHSEYWEMGLINMHKTGREFVTNPSKHLKGRSRERFCETV